MDLIMFHSGSALPSYLECTFRQIRLFNPGITIHFLTDPELLQNKLFETYKICAVDKDAYYSKKIENIASLYGKKANDFWVITTTRLIYFENYIKDKDLTSVVHFENDVLVYHTIQDHALRLKLFQNLAIAVGGDDKAMTGFMYIGKAEYLSAMTEWWIYILNKLGKHGVCKKYNLDMINEMTLMRAYQIERGEYWLGTLPSLPFGKCSKLYPMFNSIFDPASWGQFVGGTLGEGPGAKPEDHYIGQLLRKHPEYDVVWKLDAQSRKIPYFKYADKEVKINNLHIHSKNLSKYVSYD
jgi:hypothetical protein